MKGISEVISTILMLLITIAITGTAYVFISQTYTLQSQGLELIDATCTYGNATENATIRLRNAGSVPVNTANIVVIQLRPSTAVSASWGNATIESGGTATVSDECEGGDISRNCIYRISPPAGRTIEASVLCLS